MMEAVPAGARLQHRVRHLEPAAPALSPNVVLHDRNTKRGAPAADKIYLLFGVIGEHVDRYYCGKAEREHVLYMLFEVRQPFAKRVHVDASQMFLRQPAVHLERADRGHDDDGVWPEPGHAAFDVEEFLRAEVCGETRLRD